MSNPIKDILDKESMIKDIAERNNIIYNYQRCGFLDRDNAIKKIQELRVKDKDVLAVASASIIVSSIPISQATNNQLVEELIMQRNILQEKQIKKQLEEQK